MERYDIARMQHDTPLESGDEDSKCENFRVFLFLCFTIVRVFFLMKARSIHGRSAQQALPFDCRVHAWLFRGRPLRAMKGESHGCVPGKRSSGATGGRT